MLDVIKKALEGVTKSTVVSGCLTNVVPWKLPRQKDFIVLNGDSVARVYVYDATPIAAIDPNNFVLTVAYCDGILHSKYTNNVYDTKSNRSVIVMFNNEPVGTIAIKRSKVENFAKKGTAIQVTAFSDGWIQFGSQSIRNVKAKVPADWKE